MKNSTRWTVGGAATLALALGATGVAAANADGEARDAGEQRVVQAFATELGVQVEQLDDAYVAVLEGELADAVAAGEITQAEADEELAEAREEGFELDLDVEREDDGDVEDGDGDDEEITDPAVIASATEAAEREVPGGKVGEVEAADEDAPEGVVYEVEVTDASGEEVDVLLDEAFAVVTTERWVDETPEA